VGNCAAVADLPQSQIRFSRVVASHSHTSLKANLLIGMVCVPKTLSGLMM
jgi:hypothetical protein